MNEDKKNAPIRDFLELKNEEKKKWFSEKNRELVWRSYFLFLVFAYELYVILLKLDKWDSFDSLIITLGYSATILFVLYYLLINKKIYSFICDLFLRLAWLNQVLRLTIHHLILITIVGMAIFSKVSIPMLFFIVTILILVIVHILIKYLQSKSISTNNPYMVLWLGLISTFIGFTLSIYGQEVFNEKDDKENLVALLDVAIDNEKNIDEVYEDKITNLIISYKEKYDTTLSDITITELPKDDALEKIITSGDLYNSFSPVAKDELHILNKGLFTHSLDEGLVNISKKVLADTNQELLVNKNLDEDDNKMNKQFSKKEYKELIKHTIDNFYKVRLKREELLIILELERDYLSGSISLTEYNKLIDQKKEESKQHYENLKKVKLEDYLENYLGDEIFNDIIVEDANEPKTIYEKINYFYEDIKFNINKASIF